MTRDRRPDPDPRPAATPRAELGAATQLQQLTERFGAAGAQRFIQRRQAQRQATAAQPAADVHAAAAQGTSGAGGPLPHLAAIQQSFGKHDVAHVQAHTDDAARAGASAMGAEAFASGNQVAFASSPSLHTAAHEAAHVVQQRAGVHLKGGVGEEGDPHERHADAVADQVVRGESSEALLDRYAGAPSGGVQRAVQHTITATGSTPSSGSSPSSAPASASSGSDAAHAVDESAAAALPHVALPAVLDMQQTHLDSLTADGAATRAILRDTFGGNWFTAKHVLLEETPTARAASADKTVGNDKELRGRLMDKLIAMRHWESEEVLRHVRDIRLPADIPASGTVAAKQRLDWDNSGSGVRTSDVDLSLKGTYNRQAIGLFNAAFRARGWGAEPGIVYDVNVYAQTFLGNAEDVTVDDEGLHAPKLMPARAEDQREAELDQEAWSLVKIARYMTVEQWESYQTKALTGLTAEAKSKMQAALLKADQRIKRYRQALSDKRASLGRPRSEGNQASEMEVANRLYEDKLDDIIANDARLTAEQARGGAGDAALIATLKLNLREQYSESEMFSNESYITDGALNHVVMGLQKGTNGDFVAGKRGNDDRSAAPIQLGAEEFLQSFNEQLGDICKELGRVKEDGSDLAHHVYQGGKYFFRMIDAAKGLFGGALPKPIEERESFALVEKVGRLALGIKDEAKKYEKGLGPEVDTSGETQATVLTVVPGGGNKVKTANLRQAVVELGLAVAKSYKQRRFPPPAPGGST